MRIETKPEIASTTFWAIISALLVLGGLFSGIMESRFRALDTLVNIIRATPITPEANARISVLEHQVTRLELDVRNHTDQFSLIREMLTANNIQAQKYFEILERKKK